MLMEPENVTARRLDQHVAETVGTSISRAFAAKLISDGKVTVNKRLVDKPGYRMRAGDHVSIDFVPEDVPEIPLIKLPVLYEDNDCVVIYKPLGTLAHSKGAFNPEATVASWLEQKLAPGYDPSSGRAGIVHRLDRATSGVMICAKTPEALSWLQKQFSQRRVKKTYMAIINGIPSNPEAIIEMPIERNPKAPATFRVGPNGKSALTHYKVVDETKKYSLLELKPTTGRTHQLRVHLKQIGHPIVGDVVYGGEPADRLYLHAHALELTLPNRERTTFSVPLPDSFNELLDGDR